MSLGLNSSAWEATVTASPDALQQEISSKNVAHVLSKAVTRGPQKMLAKLVCGANFNSTLHSAAGQKILQSLISFGTVKTVGMVCAELNNAKISLMTTEENVATIVRAVALRIDNTGDERKTLLSGLVKKGEVHELLSTKWSLNFAAEVALADQSILSSLVRSKKAEAALKSKLSEAIKPKEAIHFTETLLAKCDEADREAVSTFVLAAIGDALKPKSEHRPREEVLLAFASHGSGSALAKLTSSITSWDTFGAMLLKSDGARIIASLLARSDESAGVALADKILSCADAKVLTASKHASVLSILTTIQQRFPQSCTKNGVSSGILAAASVKFSRATKPAFVATKDRILEKIRALEAQKAQKVAQATPTRSVSAEPTKKKRRVE